MFSLLSAYTRMPAIRGQDIRYGLTFVSAFFPKPNLLECEWVAVRSQLTFYKEGMRQKKQPRAPCPDTIRRCMLKPKGGREKCQNSLSFLRNHMHVPWGMDLFTVPTMRFQILYVFVVLNHSRQVVHLSVTAHPTIAWVIQQLGKRCRSDYSPLHVSGQRWNLRRRGGSIADGNRHCGGQDSLPESRAESIHRKVG